MIFVLNFFSKKFIIKFVDVLVIKCIENVRDVIVIVMDVIVGKKLI